MTANLIHLVETSNISIDSLKLKIKETDIEVLNSKLIDDWNNLNINTKTKQTEFVKKLPKSYTYSSDGIQIIFKLEYQNAYDYNLKRLHSVRYLTMGISSKVLKTAYFDGIQANNLKTVYDFIISLKVAQFDYQTFLDGLCTDIDLKFDFEINHKEFSQFTKHLQSCAKPTIKKKEGCNRFDQKLNRGIEFADRKTPNYLSRPFLKFYDKRTELLHNSSEFYRNHLFGNVNEGLCRAETTIKNRTHLDSLKISNSSIHNLSNVTRKRKQEIFNVAIEKNMSYTVPILDKEVIKPNENIKLSPSEKFIQYLLIKNELSTDEINAFLNDYKTYDIEHITRNSKYNFKKRMKAIYGDF